MTIARAKLKRKKVRGVAFIDGSFTIHDPKGEAIDIVARNIMVVPKGQSIKMKPGDAHLGGPLSIQGDFYISYEH